MSYIALARKWRPKKFAEMIGQEHVRVALTNALTADRVHHAFLFTGTRGVGKTTIARILAKCLNCEKGPTAEPCGVCSACTEIDSGRFVDLIEVDAASRTKVDDTRELLDNVQYAPTRGRYKVYLIDEVHMLSSHSFNALLKTLEEPPPRVKFLLATTDPQKLPVTVLSRCLQFNLKRLSSTLIAERIKYILEQEGIEYDAAAIRLVAQGADGSVRDGLSLLDQLIAFGGGKVKEDEARSMLGTIARDHVVRLGDLLSGENASELITYARSLEEWAPDYAQVLDELASLFARIALKQVVPDFEGDELYDPALIERLAKSIAAEDVQLFYQTAIIGRRDLHLAPDPRTGFEMTLLRMIAFRPGDASAQSAPPVAAQSAPRFPPPKTTTAAAPMGAPPTAQMPSASTAAAARPVAVDPSAVGRSAAGQSAVGPSAAGESWQSIVSRLDLQGASRQLANNCALIGRTGNVVRLAIDPKSHKVRTPAQEEKLAQALSKFFGEPVRVEFDVAEPGVETPAQAEQRMSREELDAARRTLEDDPAVRAFKDRFGATLLPDTVRPNK